MCVFILKISWIKFAIIIIEAIDLIDSLLCCVLYTKHLQSKHFKNTVDVV